MYKYTTLRYANPMKTPTLTHTLFFLILLSSVSVNALYVCGITAAKNICMACIPILITNIHGSVR